MSTIPGIAVTPDFISPEEETALVEGADSNEDGWSPAGIGRRWLKFWSEGFDREPVEVDPESEEPPPRGAVIPRNALAMYPWRHLPIGIPAWADAVVAKLAALNENAPFRLLVNDYGPGVGCPPHIDESWLVPHEAFIVSALEDEVVTFTREGQEPVQVSLPRRSLLRLSGEALTLWKHEVAGPAVRRTSFHFCVEATA